MASFDLETYLKVKGTTGTSTLEAVGMSFGLPSCMLDLGKQALSLLPTNILLDVRSSTRSAQLKGREKVAQAFKWLGEQTGIFRYDGESGTFSLGSDSSWLGIDLDGAGVLDGLNQFIGGAEQLYDTFNDVKDSVDAALNCISKYKEMKDFSKGASASQKTPNSENEFAAETAALKRAEEFISKCDTLISTIDEIVKEREETPFDLDGILGADPGLSDDGIFRLTFGPPVSVDGQYALTSDGLYYDSKSGGLDPVYLAISGIVPVGDKWKYNYDSNLGGKGEAISVDSLNKFSDNIFDPELVDDSKAMQTYYKEDHFLAVLKQQRDKHVFDLSADLKTFEDAGEGASVISNQKQLIISEIANHNTKINRRKKQIEVAVKAPQIYGNEKYPVFAPGNIPINDFSYLGDYNLQVDLEKQKALVFDQADVNGIVLPIKPKFVKSTAKPASIGFNHLNVPKVGKGSILYSASGNGAAVLSLNDLIVSEDLFAIYNFLETKVELPSSTDFFTTNCATEDMYNNAQLAAPSPQSTFVSGLGVPYLEGIVKNSSNTINSASGMGSYVRLPDSKEFRDLTYSPSGFTLECWVHVPNIMDGEIGWLSSTTSSLTKVLIGNENVGSVSGYSPVDSLGQLQELDFLKLDNGDKVCKGMLCGFTRDRRLTQASASYSSDNAANDPVSSMSFFLAPVQGRDASSAGFVNKEACGDYADFYKMKVDLADTGFGNVSSQFVLVDITCDPSENSISFFADGSLVATSSISEVFGVNPGQAIQMPGFKKNNSFEYGEATVSGPNTLKSGPKLGPFYTPWIVGGGYTDGMYQHGNFMGGNHSGIVSGLRGHVGSLKFYSRPLNSLEVEKNYKAQKGFFKNIKT